MSLARDRTTGTDRLALVIPAFGEPGARRPGYWRYIIQALESVFQAVDVLEPRLKPRLWWYSYGNRRWRALHTPPLGFIRDVARSEGTTFLCVEYGLSTLATLIAARFSSHSYVLIFQEHRPRLGSEVSRPRKFWRRTLSRMASGVIANTEAAYNDALSSLACDPSRVSLVPLLVPPPQAEMLQLPYAVEAPKQRPLFLYVGQLVPVKNVEAILTASRRLVDKEFPLEVWIVGSGPEHAPLLKLRDAMRLNEVVRFLGTVDHQSLGFVYQACDAFIMPTLSDYRSMAVLEALRFGKPVIDSTADGNAHDSIHDGVNGLLFDPLEADELVACMQHLVDKPELAQKLGRRGAQMMETLTPSNAAEALVGALPLLTGRRR